MSAIEFQKQVATQIRHRLLDLRLTVKDLCYQSGVSAGAWHSFQSGDKPAKIETMLKLTQVVGLDITISLKESPEMGG